MEAMDEIDKKMIENAYFSCFPEIRKGDRLEMYLLNNFRYTFDNTDDASLSANCFAFLYREVRGQGELQNSSRAAGSASVLLKNMSTEDIPADTGSFH